VDESVYLRSEHRLVFFESRCKSRRESHAVIGTLARDDLVFGRLAFALPVVARGFEGGVVGFGATRGEHGGVQPLVGETRQLVRELDRGEVGHARKVGREREFERLVVRGLREFGVAVSRVDVPQTRHAIEDFLSIHSVEPDALAAFDDERVGVTFWMIDGMQLFFVFFEPFGICGHAASIVKFCNLYFSVIGKNVILLANLIFPFHESL